VDHENAQIVREFSELMWTDRGLTFAPEPVHPEAVFDWSASRAPFRGVLHGHAAIREAAEALFDAWEEWDPQFEEVIEIDPETILAVKLRPRSREGQRNTRRSSRREPLDRTRGENNRREALPVEGGSARVRGGGGRGVASSRFRLTYRQ
jgi:hypothetical protein